METFLNECRFCFSEEDPHEMISPCLCQGSIKFVHHNCLRDWFTKKPYVENVEGGKVFCVYPCDVCKLKIRFLKEFENGLVSSIIKTLFSIFFDLKNFTIFVVQYLLLKYFLQRMSEVATYEYLSDLSQKNFLNTFNELVIYGSILFGIGDIFRYFSAIFRENRRHSLRFHPKRI